MQEEFSLREVIETIWKGKVIITVVAVVAAILTGIFNYFIVSPIYEASSLVVVNQTDEKFKANLDSYVEQITTEASMGNIRKKLGYNHEVTFDSIQVQHLKESNSIKVTVKGTDKAVVTRMANGVATQLAALIEISDRMNMLVGYQRDLIAAENNLKVTTSELEAASNHLKQLPEKIVVYKSISDDPYLRSIVTATNGDNLEFSSEIINLANIELNTKIAELEVTRAQYTTELQNLKNQIQENENEIKELEQIQVQASNEGRTKIMSLFQAIYISPSVEPVNPVAPKKVLNMAVALVAGLIGGTALVFTRHYMRQTKPYSNQGISA